nr:MAG TPA: hypothetical protein [Herelleviridae sp.]
MTENSRQIPIFDSVYKPHIMRMEEIVDRTLLWLGGLNIVSRMMAVVAIMLGAVIVGAFLAFAMVGVLCLIAN